MDWVFFKQSFKNWILILLKMCKKNRCSLKTSSPQFSLWVFALSSQAPCSRLCLLSLILTASLVLSGAEEGIQALLAQPPPANRKKWVGATFQSAFRWHFGEKLGFLIRLGGWDSQLEKSIPSLQAEYEARIPKALTLHILKRLGLYMRSYPLLGLFLATRHAVSKTTSSPAILRPTATGVSLLFLSLTHSSAVIEVRVTGVICWPQCWEVILPLSASASQKRKPRERDRVAGPPTSCIRQTDGYK